MRTVKPILAELALQHVTGKDTVTGAVTGGPRVFHALAKVVQAQLPHAFQLLGTRFLESRHLGRNIYTLE